MPIDDLRSTTIPLYTSEVRPAMPAYDTDEPAHDSYGRPINYLRISLTDRCNFRCVYCMPAIGMQFLPRPELLTNDELLRVVDTTMQPEFVGLWLREPPAHSRPQGARPNALLRQ